MAQKKILFGAAYSAIEPLGLLHLGGLARDMGYEREYCLVKNEDYSEFHEKIRQFRPGFVGFNVYTGSHKKLYVYLEKLKKDFPDVKIILGGPHPSYFPHEASMHSDYVVVSEGFTGLKAILRGDFKKGVYPPAKEPHVFPFPDRKKFYETHKQHRDSPIKSIITMTGCPFRCTYCYNSSNIKDISSGLPDSFVNEIGQKRLGGRLFAWNSRTVDAVIAEAKELKENYQTKMIYFQDDVFGMKTEWLEEFSERWPKEIGIRWHAQMRWEMTHGEAGKARLDLCKKGGCCGLTLAIEAADPNIRAEVLDRKMPEEIIFEGMKNSVDRGFKVRTEQITGLPYGATNVPTKINLDADLEILELNVRLKKATGGPHLSWASTFVPYARTRLGMYSVDYGFYENPEGENWDIKDTFFEKSVLRFLKKYTGPSLKARKNEKNLWLQGEELETYRKQNAELRRHFNVFAYLHDGHIFAKKYITSNDYSFETLGKTVREWNNTDMKQESKFCEKIDKMDSSQEIKKAIKELAPYFLSVPGEISFAERFINYAKKKGLTMNALSDSARHHLYDHVLYYVSE
jgi:anaerobic magnesium-protoporphyrin IX monomethyl ester cyclase